MNGERTGKRQREKLGVRKVKDWERRGNGPFRIPAMRSGLLQRGRAPPFPELTTRAGGHEGMLGGKNPGQVKPPKRVREASHLILKNGVNSAKERLSLITDRAASCILTQQFRTTEPPKKRQV